MKTKNIVFISVVTIVIGFWAIVSFAADDLTLGQRTEHVVDKIGKAVSSVGDKLSTTSKTVGEYTDDSVITAKVKQQLFDEPSINSFDISVTTDDGIVTLAGFVTAPELALKALQIATNVEGVKQVNDTLLIKAKSQKTIKGYISDTTITSEIKTGLLAKKGISSLSIQVKTVDGIVQLTGYVDSLDQQFLAEEVAWKVEGVQSVKNNLLVKNN